MGNSHHLSMNSTDRVEGETDQSDANVSEEQQDLNAPAPEEPPALQGIIGTPGNDTLTGTDGPDVIFALAGDDVVHAGAGDDIVFGGRGADQLFGELGNDQLFGGPDNDTIDGGQGDDVMLGGRGDDVLIAGTPASGLGAQGELVFGGPGNDQISMFEVIPGGGRIPSFGTAYGGAGDDIIRDSEFSDRLFGGPGNDTISGSEGSDLIYGGPGDDILSALTADAAVGGATLFGGGGNDQLSGGFTTPAMFGGTGDDVLQPGRFEPGPFGLPEDFKLVFDGGPGFDTLRFGPGPGDAPFAHITLSADDNVSGIEQMVMLNADDILTVDRDGVLGASDETDTLIVDTTRQFDGGRIDAIGAWTQTGAQDIDGITFNQWQLDGATLLVNPSIDFHLL